MDDPNMHAYGEAGPDDAEIGRQWREDSSLVKWFPLTAERLAVLEAENAALKREAHTCSADTIRMLRAQLRIVTDDLEALLEDGFPRKGRSNDDKDAHLQWWEQRWSHVAWARKALDLSEQESA